MKTLVIGNGHAGKMHAKAWREHGANAWVIDRDPNVADVASVDYVSICSPDQHHALHIKQAQAAWPSDALFRPRHVLCEKPLVLRTDELPVPIHGSGFLSCNFLLRTGLQRLPVEEPWICKAVYAKKRPIKGTWREHRDYRALLAGGSHMLDAALWVSGAYDTIAGKPIEIRSIKRHYGNPATMSDHRIQIGDNVVWLSTRLGMNVRGPSHTLDFNQEGIEPLKATLKEGKELSMYRMIEDFIDGGKRGIAPSWPEIEILHKILFACLEADETGKVVRL